MDNLYDQLISLSHLPNAYEEWTEYRSALTAFIISSTISGGTALIVGAGESNDLDLARLAVHFSSITLLDCDSQAMKRALIRYRTQKAQIRCVKTDLLGISPESYRQTADMILDGLKTGKKGTELDGLFLGQIENGYQTRRPDPLPEPYRWDNVICCGVHSQLLSMYMRMACVYARYAAIDLSRIEKKLQEYNRELIPVVNESLIKAAGHRFVIGAENGRIGETGGIEGSLQALCDPQLERLPLLDRIGLVWNLDPAQNKLYKIEIRAYQTDCKTR